MAQGWPEQSAPGIDPVRRGVAAADIHIPCIAVWQQSRSYVGIELGHAHADKGHKHALSIDSGEHLVVPWILHCAYSQIPLLRMMAVCICIAAM